MPHVIKLPLGKAVRPNLGIERAFQRRLDKLIGEMHVSLVHWLTQQYEAKPPEVAMDASAARELRAAMRKLSRRWQRNFDEAAPEMAEYFSRDIADRSDRALAAILVKAGYTTRMTLSPAMNDVLQGVIGDNVALIKSIASEHLSDVEGLVMRSVQTGRDVGTLTKGLQEAYGVTRKRAALIARTQNNQATATLQRARQLDVGIEQAQWRHSGGGKVPRPSHVAFAAGRDGGPIYDVAKGALIEGKRIWPGTEINCRCVSIPIIPGLPKRP